MDACGVGRAAGRGRLRRRRSREHARRTWRSASAGSTCPRSVRSGSASIIPLEGVPPATDPVVHGRLHPLGPGKESTTGHWELMGVVPAAPAAHLPGGLPAGRDRAARGGHRAALLLQPALQRHRGDRGLRRPHHLETGEVILYTSADSVLQLAAHVDVLSEPELLRGLRGGARGDDRRARGRPRDRAAVRRASRAASTGARAGATTRRRRPGRSYLEEIQDAGPAGARASGRSATCSRAWASPRSTRARTNAKGIASTTRLLEELDAGLIFVNLVETDQVYGHRHDVEGFHEALKEIDAAVAGWLAAAARRRPAGPHRRPRRGPERPATPTTRASTRRCWPASPGTTAAATTARSPTSAPACCAG